MSMTKLIYSDMLPEALCARAEIVWDERRFMKQAASAVGWNYAELTPDKDHVGIHLIALGEFEKYGQNRNGDSFPKAACIGYHDTFVKHGHVFHHHENHDPEKALGPIVKSAYVEPMGRVELFIHAHREKAAEELEKLEKSGEVSFSMACRVAFDRCGICNTLRKSASDPKQCDHVKHALGKLLDDGQVVCTHNDEPKFFDISFVYRPADRIAWSLAKVAAAAGFPDSIKLAADAGLWVPEELSVDSPEATEKLALAKKLAAYEQLYWDIAERGPRTSFEQELWSLRKAAATAALDDSTLRALRRFDPADVFCGLANSGIVLSASDFCKYALGERVIADCSEEQLARAVNGIFDRLQKRGSLASICDDSRYGVDLDLYRTASLPLSLRSLLTAGREQASFSVKQASQRAVVATMDGVLAAVTPSTRGQENADLGVAGVIASEYATYKLAAARALQALSSAEDFERQLALLAAQNVTDTTRSQ